MTDQEQLAALTKTVEDKDQAIFLLNELLDKTDAENETLRQQVRALETSRKEAYTEGWQDCEEHQKSRLGERALDDEHPLGKDYQPSMPWTSREDGDRE